MSKDCLLTTLLLCLCNFSCGKSLSFQEVPVLTDVATLVGNQSEGCGGVLEAYRGFLSYKLKVNYENNERCIWTIKSTRAVILFALLEDGFEPQYDFLTVYNLDKSGVLVRSGRLTHGFREFAESTGSTTFLTFTSDRSTIGQGFSLEYIGFGPSDVNVVGELGYSNLFSSSQVGLQAFPKGRTFQSSGYTFVSHIIHPNTTSDSLKFALTVDSLDMATFYSGCENNYFSVHQLTSNSFDVRLRYCEPHEMNLSTFTSTSPLLVTFFGYLNANRQGFKLSWNVIETTRQH